MTDPDAIAASQAVTMFREILFLPLRLTRYEDRDLLERQFDSLPGPWRKSEKSLAFPPSSKVWPTASSRAKVKDGGIDEDAEDYQLRQAYGEIAYFHPYVQRFLYGFSASDRPIATRIHDGIEKACVRIAYDDPWPGAVAAFPEATEFECELPVERIELNLVKELGLVLMVLELAADANIPLKRFAGNKEIDGKHQISMPEVLALKDALRRVYPPYFEALGRVKNGDTNETVEMAKWKRSLFPESVRFIGPGAPEAGVQAMGGTKARAIAAGLAENGALPVAPWWQALLHPLLSAKGVAGAPLLEQVVDDRMPSLSFVAVPDFNAVDLATQVRLCFADAPGSGFPYSKDFLADFVPRHCYDRFVHFGTRYLFSSYSMVALCQTGVKPGEKPADFDFTLDVLQEHARRQYTRMMMLSQMQRASLLAFSNWISVAMHESRDLRERKYRERIDRLRHAFAAFTQISWFSNVSNQEQARDIFALMQKHLGTSELQGEVLSELDGARAVLTEIDEERQAEASATFNIIGLCATMIGLPLAAMGLMEDVQLSQFSVIYLFWLALTAACVALLAAIQAPGASIIRPDPLDSSCVKAARLAIAPLLFAGVVALAWYLKSLIP